MCVVIFRREPTLWQLLLYALQQVIVMFPATVAVAIITGFHISTTIFASGLATIVFLLLQVVKSHFTMVPVSLMWPPSAA